MAMKITRKQLRQMIKEAVSVPVDDSAWPFKALDSLDLTTERTRGILKAKSHNDIKYSEKSVGKGPERVDKALQQELDNLKRLVRVLEKQLVQLGFTSK